MAPGTAILTDPRPRPLVLGLTGPNASGKGEVAAWLAARGFRVHSLSDAVRVEARARGLSTSREDLIRVGNDLRKREGPGVLARRTLPSIGARDVVDSIRNPAEVQVLRTLPNFVLLGIRAPESLRFARALARARPGDATTIEEFRRREEQENASDPASQQLTATFGLADHVVENAEDLDALARTLYALLAALTDDAGVR